ncbi:FecR/PupR family sigma factor regulator, partial [Bordetella pertussis]
MAREAARWLVRLGSGQASADEIQACDHWRASHAEHERAWQRARRLTSMF